jgi:hypothetical protein
MLEVDYKIGKWLKIVSNTRFLVPAMLKLQVTVTVLVTWVLSIYARSRAMSDSYLRHVCPSTLITTLP